MVMVSSSPSVKFQLGLLCAYPAHRKLRGCRGIRYWQEKRDNASVFSCQGNQIEFVAFFWIEFNWCCFCDSPSLCVWSWNFVSSISVNPWWLRLPQLRLLINAWTFAFNCISISQTTQRFSTLWRLWFPRNVPERGAWGWLFMWLNACDSYLITMVSSNWIPIISPLHRTRIHVFHLIQFKPLIKEFYLLLHLFDVHHCAAQILLERE